MRATSFSILFGSEGLSGSSAGSLWLLEVIPSRVGRLPLGIDVRRMGSHGLEGSEFSLQMIYSGSSSVFPWGREGPYLWNSFAGEQGRGRPGWSGQGLVGHLSSSSSGSTSSLFLAALGKNEDDSLIRGCLEISLWIWKASLCSKTAAGMPRLWGPGNPQGKGLLMTNHSSVRGGRESVL